MYNSSTSERGMPLSPVICSDILYNKQPNNIPQGHKLINILAKLRQHFINLLTPSNVHLDYVESFQNILNEPFVVVS